MLGGELGSRHWHPLPYLHAGTKCPANMATDVFQGTTQNEPVHPQSSQGRTKGRLLLWLLSLLRMRL